MGDKFWDILLASLDQKPFQNKICTLDGKNITITREANTLIQQKEFASRRESLVPIEKGSKNENGRVASPESIPIHHAVPNMGIFDASVIPS